MQGQVSPDAFVLRASQWCYRGIWSVLTRWFQVPSDPPTLPLAPGESLTVFRPSQAFLNYQRFYFWIGLVIVDVVLSAIWLAIGISYPVIGILITPIALTIIILPDILVYIAIHLKYDTTWYLLTNRSLRIRRGIWIIHETTITFENIQNIHLQQGPVQRYFGFANLSVETAGGGGGAAGEGAHGGSHQGVLEGLDHATEVRDIIMVQLKKSTKSGLGDDREVRSDHSKVGISHEAIEVLRQIRTLTEQLV
jgi:membrane protein YdbS with pleckstrin-like domain